MSEFQTNKFHINSYCGRPIGPIELYRSDIQKCFPAHIAGYAVPLIGKIENDDVIVDVETQQCGHNIYPEIVTISGNNYKKFIKFPKKYDCDIKNISKEPEIIYKPPVSDCSKKKYSENNTMLLVSGQYDQNVKVLKNYNDNMYDNILKVRGHIKQHLGSVRYNDIYINNVPKIPDPIKKTSDNTDSFTSFFNNLRNYM